MIALHDWQTFYTLTGTAAATLIGLLFVALSVGTNLPREQSMNSLHTFVNPTLLNYIYALLVSCVAVMPLKSALFLNIFVVVLAIASVLLPLKIVWRILVIHRDDNIDFDHWIWHCWLPLGVGLLLACVAIAILAGVLSGESFALFGLAIGTLLFIAIGLHNTWQLMLWLLLRRHEPSHESPLEKVI